MNFSDMTFIRKFSLNLYKSLNVPMSKMTFTSDFISTVRGDLYPLVESSDSTVEKLSLSAYSTASGHAERVIAGFFPFATSRVNIASVSNGAAGFAFVNPSARVAVYLENDGWENNIVIKHNDGEKKVLLAHEIDDSFALIVTARPGFFDIYVSRSGVMEFVVSEHVPSFEKSNSEDFYQATKIRTYLSGKATITGAETYIDCGIGQADIRPFRYENGELIQEDGRVFLAISARMASGGHHIVLSWLPGTCDFKMEGAIFYSNGDGKIYGEVAGSYVFNRMDGKWHLWIRNGSAGHVLSYASFDYDVRYGVNVVDVNPLPLMTKDNFDDFALLGKKGDEDPDFTYDETRKKWLFALCRVDEETKKYRYMFYESDYPDKDYKFIGIGPAGEETGGSIVRLDGKIYFVCGNSFKAVSDYRVYEWGKFDSFTNLKCDYPDGGFRGWGTVMPIRYGTRIRYFWLTFDRKLMSPTFNWSYGNLYCFEAAGIYKA